MKSKFRHRTTSGIFLLITKNGVRCPQKVPCGRNKQLNLLMVLVKTRWRKIQCFTFIFQGQICFVDFVRYLNWQLTISYLLVPSCTPLEVSSAVWGPKARGLCLIGCFEVFLAKNYTCILCWSLKAAEISLNSCGYITLLPPQYHFGHH